MELKLAASMSSRAPAVRALLLALLATLASAPSAMAQSANGVMATFIDYNAPPNYDMHAASVSCAALDGDKPKIWREYYWWAAFCGPAGPRGDAACGLCVQLTNVAAGTIMTVRIVDDCGKTNGGAVLGIDTAGFYQLDTDLRGRVAGQLEVNYQFVECQQVLDG